MSLASTVVNTMSLAQQQTARVLQLPFWYDCRDFLHERSFLQNTCFNFDIPQYRQLSEKPLRNS